MSDLDDLKKEVTALHTEFKALSKQVVIVGTIVPYGGADEPGDGWLLCDGRPLDRGEYTDLYGVIGTNFGAPDATHFNLPDLRGRFVRGVDVDHGQDSDPRDPDADDRKESAPGGNVGNKVGSVQEDAFKEHTHGYKTNVWFLNEKDGGERYLCGNGKTDSLHTDETLPSEGEKRKEETRPKNIYVNWIIYTGV